MKLGIMQPYFLPYLGYFTLINYVDEFIFFDTPQYINKGWVNRNRILKQDGSSTYITVPIAKTKRETAINKIKISKNEDWYEKIKGKLTIYKKKAPYYNQVINLLDNIILENEFTELSMLNIRLIETITEYLSIKVKFEVFSEMNLEIEQVNEPDEWALNISKAMGADTYVNLPGGQAFFDRSKYVTEKINLEFIEAELNPYLQKIGHFERGLSIIDVMMFNSADTIKDMLLEYNIR